MTSITDPARRLRRGDRIVTYSGLRGARVVSVTEVPGSDAVAVVMENGFGYLLPGAMRVQIDPSERNEP